MNREDQIFGEALDLPADQRAAFLARACGDDTAMRERLTRILAGNAAADAAFLVGQPVPRPAPLPEEQPGDRIDRYTLVRKLGDGGYGLVYLAEQTEPVRRQVALKVIKLGMDTRSVIARFEAERQALALMEHPDIAHVFDAGATATGRPFFVMELVDGVPITDFCDQHHLDVPARLALFARVCLALQHAHQKGIVHRDLKPSNILVALRDGTPAPKIIDFGIAKAVQGRLTAETFVTEVGLFIGTPAYMSPEQADWRERDIDTRSDIYSLGVLLYELLTGRPPFDAPTLHAAGVDEIRRLIREIDPPRPSTRLHTLEQANLVATAERRRTVPPKLLGQVTGDLDWIVMRCLEKDRSRRYDTAAALAQDLQRHLRDEPVEARPPDVVYRFRKLVRRHRLAFAAAALVAAALLLGVVVSTWQALRARQAEQLARREAAVATAVNDFLLADLLRQADSSVQADSRHEPDPDLKVREALDRAAARVGPRFADQPPVEAAVRQAIGESYLGLGLPAKAEPQLQRARDLRSAQLGPEAPLTLATAALLADAYLAAGRPADAVALHRELLAQRTRLLGEEHADTLKSLVQLATALGAAGSDDEAGPLLSKVVVIRRRTLGPDHPLTLDAISYLALNLRARGKYDAALALFEQELAARQRTLGATHPDTLTAANNVALVENNLGRTDAALQRIASVVDARRRTQGPEHPATLDAVDNQATFLKEAGRAAEAAPLQQQVLETRRRTQGLEHPATLASMNNLADTYKQLDRPAEAAELFREVLAVSRRTLGPEHPNTLATMNNLAGTYNDEGKLPEAEALHRELYAAQLRLVGPEHPNTIITRNNLAAALRDQGRHAEAAPLFAECVEAARKVFGPEHPITLIFMSNLAVSRAALGQSDEAIALWTDVLAIRRRVLPAGHPHTADTFVKLSGELIARRRFAEAEPLLRELLALREKNAPDAWTTFNTRSALGGALARQHKFADAEPLLLSGFEGLRAREAAIPPASRIRLREAVERLVQLYTDWDQPAKAAEWRQKLPGP